MPVRLFRHDYSILLVDRHQLNPRLTQFGEGQPANAWLGRVATIGRIEIDGIPPSRSLRWEGEVPFTVAISEKRRSFPLFRTIKLNKQIFVNLPISDLKTSTDFYESLGFVINKQFSDDTAACMVWSDSIYVMLLTHERWRTFTSRPIPPSSSSEVMLALSCESREKVDQLNAIANQKGGIADINPKQDHGFMYNRNLADPDGHVWEMFWMDLSAIPGHASPE